MSRRVAFVVAGLAGVLIVALGVVAAVALLGAGTSSRDDPRSGIEADTGRFTWGDRSVEVPLFECGREGDLVVMAGREGDVVLQVGADLGDGGAVRTGVTIDLGDDGTLGAFGPDLPLGPAGEVTDVRTVGDALVVEADWASLDPDTFAVLSPATPPTPGTLVARCPEPAESS